VTFEPKAGLVIRYDFLWKQEKDAGQEHGRKDRPCAIILTSTELQNGSRDVVLCAITHTPPSKGESAVQIPLDVARQLGLDHAQSWIKTGEVNMFNWEKGRIPHGITPARKGEWIFGRIPQGVGQQAFNQVQENIRDQTLQKVRRDET
jgi:hypothetical protein